MTVSEATQRGVAGLVSEAERGVDVVVTRHRRPVAAVIAYQRIEELSRAAEDLRDLALVLARQAGDNGSRTSLDTVLGAYGYTRDSLADLPDE
jgi:antitoxin (DNA-binding transcriptional repressor) of toxin-antitoxin stability system